MPVTTSYPGVYIEERPSFVHSVTAAPTSVTVFIGYSHPFLTRTDGNGKQIFGTAVEIFNFAGYQANFGGFFAFDPWLPDYLGNAVFQFFQNGGTVAWVVGLQAANYIDTTGKAKPQPLAAASVKLSMTPDVTLNAKQLGAVVPGKQGAADTELGIGTRVQVANLRDDGKNKNAIADLIISFGTQVETYRGVKAGEIQQQLASSALVSVPDIQNGPPTVFPSPDTYPLVFGTPPPDGTTWTLINTADYNGVFQAGASLDVNVSIFNLMTLPGISPVTDPENAVLAQAMEYCEQKRAFFIMDAPSNATTSGSPPGPAPQNIPAEAPQDAVIMDQFWNGKVNNQTAPPVSPNGAIYFPYVKTVSPLTQKEIFSPPSGLVAGVYAREDLTYSVGKAPAGLETTVVGSMGVVPWGRMTDMQQGILNKDGVNCLRDFPAIGTVVYGARTLVSANPAFEQWKYVPVRRTALFLEQSLYQSLTWAVFQENAEPLWTALTQEINAFMLTLFKQGTYFKGTTPSEAFLVQCDATTTTQSDIDAGVVNILVGFAPLKPAEFVIVQITQLAGQTQT